MSSEEIIRLVLSSILGLMGGGGLVSWFGVWHTARSQRKARRVEFLRLQLKELYGPLYFWVSANARLFNHTDGLHQAYTKEYVEKKYSRHYGAQERVSEQAKLAILITNEYVHQVTANNDRILEILEKGYFLIDLEDSVVFGDFIVDYTRMRTEIDENGRLRTPLAIYQRVGDIHFMRPQFIETVMIRFKGKREELDKLLGEPEAQPAK